MPNTPYEAGHHSFLETLRSLYKSAGAGYAVDSVMVTGVTAAGKTAPHEFDSLDQFYATLEGGENAINTFEGQPTHYGDGVFGLSVCPFAHSLRSYVANSGYPPEFREVTEQMNKGNSLTRRMRVGEGSAVSPFCVMHQPIRSAMGERFSVQGRPLLAYQLGCRASSGSGVNKLAERWIEATQVKRQLVEDVLKRHACCFCFRLGDPQLHA